MNSLYQSACTWLDRGAALLPVKPKSKYLVAGFGPYRKQITTREEAALWFDRHGAAYNLAVYLPESSGLVALDFDNSRLFFDWQTGLPVEYCLSYHETSRRGYHVFFRSGGAFPPGLKLVNGVEIKRVILVAPSTLPGFVYRPIDSFAEFVQVDDWQKLLFSLLSEREDLPVKPGREAVRGADRPGLAAGDDLVSRIKTALPVIDLASSLTQLVTSDRGAGRWWRGRCPFHEDKKPSFWVDAERQTWGCHACGTRGDVINLVAKSRGVTLQEAIRTLAGEVGQHVPVK